MPSIKRYIGTFHKTGTVLFQQIIQTAARKGIISTWLMHKGDPPAKWDVAFDYHTNSLIKTLCDDAEAARYVISIRDPRDVVVSATYYHCQSTEAWLHVPRREFGGMTYQEKINSLTTRTDQFLFEMENSTYKVINDMLKVPFAVPSIYVTRFENLVQDYEMREFRKIFHFLRFEEEVIPALIDCAHSNSIFSGRIHRSSHIRSGKPGQHLDEFDNVAAKRFEQLFGDAVAKLGYFS